MRIVLTVATGIVALLNVGCPRDRAGAPGLAVIDTSLGEVVERWDAPALTFDVAQDPVTGRVWAVAEHTSDAIPRVWELFPDSDPELRFELRPGGSGPEPAGTGYFNHAKVYWAGAHAIALDPGRRRGSFSSPGAEETSLLDIDSGDHVYSIYTGDYAAWIGASFDPVRGIGYGTTQGILYSIVTSSGQLAEGDLCPPWSSTPAVDPVGDRVFFISADSWISYLDPVAGTCATSLRHFCNGYSNRCTISGLTVSHDGERLYVAAPSIAGPTPPWDGPPSFSIWDLTAGALNDPDIQTEIVDGAGPHQFALSPDDSTLYVSMLRCDRIGVYDAITGEHRYDIRTDGETMGLDLSADGTRLFVAQVRSDSVLGKRTVEEVLRARAGGCPAFKHKD